MPQAICIALQQHQLLRSQPQLQRSSAMVLGPELELPPGPGTRRCGDVRSVQQAQLPRCRLNASARKPILILRRCQPASCDDLVVSLRRDCPVAGCSAGIRQQGMPLCLPCLKAVQDAASAGGCTDTSPCSPQVAIARTLVCRAGYYSLELPALLLHLPNLQLQGAAYALQLCNLGILQQGRGSSD